LIWRAAVTEAAFAGTGPPDERQRFDSAALERWLRPRLADAGGELLVEQFRGGQSNPTFLLKLDGVPCWVLRKKPNGPLLPSAHAVEREHRVMAALGAAGFPVPRMLALCEDERVLGTPFFVMEYVAGRTFWDPTLPGLAPAQRSAIYDETNRVIATLHGLDPQSLGLADYGRPGGYIRRQVERWTRQYRASQTADVPEMERLIEWLPANVPDDDGASVVHGDYRLDNLIFHPTEPRVVAVLDWELSTLGSPLADFAYHAMGWRMPLGELGGLAGCDLAALGIPSESESLQAWCRRTGRGQVDPRTWEYCIAYNLFRVACIRQGILRRALQGNASSARAHEVGERARTAAIAAWRGVEERLLEGSPRGPRE
jgi:aminoglycoside phosphotransferase (APT) family kinase protein